jgi:hypothetical protein
VTLSGSQKVAAEDGRHDDEGRLDGSRDSGAGGTGELGVGSGALALAEARAAAPELGLG